MQSDSITPCKHMFKVINKNVKQIYYNTITERCQIKQFCLYCQLWIDLLQHSPYLSSRLVFNFDLVFPAEI